MEFSFTVLESGQDEFSYSVQLIKDDNGYCVFYEKTGNVFEFGSDYKWAKRNFDELIYND